ncbi:MAG: AbrB/MazE/SpoVT family DNA-binding domain-containing protein [Methanosarcinales archaeon]|nr:AbrB/MazE/SpoVT family DNA-binding domain-containing protein [Methanosarcinales archaeon]
MIQKVKLRKKGQITIPSRLRKRWNVDEGSELIIETRANELVLHPLVSDSINEGFGLFGKEKLNSDQLKMFIERSRIKSNNKND